MSYQVLARKWRPRTFREMVGQEHVLQALINALDHDRLHHAYLFTGTRGVGKTTIGRILAKCLNCEVGVSSSPCNECSACTEINEGRFVDLIEVDAASRTKVEDTRELLENVQYAPTRGRYKVYLIDEVHMLSNSSFNALLKTLEEPPPHVKFLLATTDPQKLPVTILSRCLQFNLKNMNPERIVSHLQFILEKEMVPFEDAALWQLARSADGSMRDALSLTDQSIAFGDGKVTDADVRTMLGTIDQLLVYKVVDALIEQNASALLQAVEGLAEHAPDYSAALAELITIFHRIAIAQALPEAVDNSQGDRQKIYDFAQAISAEDVQLYYQTALLGRRDLPMVPDARSGFEMVLLRMLAFKPQGVVHLPTKTVSSEPITPAPSIAPQAALSESNPPVPVEQSVSAEPEPQYSPPPMTEPVVAPVSPEMPAPDMASMPADIPPHEGVEPVKKPSAVEAATHPVEQTPEPELVANVPEPAPEAAVVLENNEVISENEASTEPPFDGSADIYTQLVEHAPEVPHQPEPEPVEMASVDAEAAKVNVSDNISLDAFNSQEWVSVYLAVNPGGLLQSTAANSQLVSWQNGHLEFVLDQQQSTLYDEAHQERLAELLSEYFAQPVTVSITVGDVTAPTPAQIIIRRQQLRQQEAEASIAQDPVVQQLQALFDASIIEGSIAPVDSGAVNNT